MSGSAVMASDLAAAVTEAGPRLVGEDRPVRDLVHDSRDVAPGSGFVAVRGAYVDGHEHVPAACAAKASLVVVDHEVDTPCTQLVIDDTRARMGALASAVHRHPATEMRMVGITGTNGKTTVTHMLESIFAAAGQLSGIAGTIGAHIGGDVVPLARTTPEATDLQRLLRRMADAGVAVAALEVSSHALTYGRTDDIVFDIAAFTNLSQDHLDFHDTMEEYFQTKATLFTPNRARHAVLWMEDPSGERIATMTSLPVTTVGFAGRTDWDVSGTILEWGLAHTVLGVELAGESITTELPLAGRFNAANALLAAAIANHLGIGGGAIASGLVSLSPIPGRFEQVPNRLGLTVVVDYAHTPDAVRNAIATAAEVASGRVIAIVGAAGDRDPAKRGPMGEAAASADLALVTSDNPRSEDPAAIVEQVLAGAGGRSSAVKAVVDREAAIAAGISEATPGDIVLILGKGHEPYQEFADRTIEFDDRAVAAAQLGLRERETP